MSHGESSVTTFNPAKLREEMANRGFTMGEMAKRAGMHVNTLANSLRSGRCEIETLRRIVYVLDTVPPIAGIVALRGLVARRKLAIDMVGPVSAPLEKRLRAHEERELERQRKDPRAQAPITDP